MMVEEQSVEDEPGIYGDAETDRSMSQVAAQTGSIAPPQDSPSPRRLDSLGLGFY